MSDIVIIGMGALGLLYGDLLQQGPDTAVRFVVDEARQARYLSQPPTVNGAAKRFDFVPAGAKADPADLVIFAVKATALDQAMEDAAGYVGPDTILLSLLNGITSERSLEARFGAKNVVYCVAQGMDATRQERSLVYSKQGTLCVGIPDGRSPAALEALRGILDRCGVPYSVDGDIMHRLWSKFMLNVGVNQVVMVCEGNYGTVQAPGEPRERMIAAMREVIALSALEGVPVTEEDLNFYVGLVDTLAPEGMPSMRQDGLARRKSEVELFSGTVCRLAARHGLDVPVNRALYDAVRAMEAKYDGVTA